MTMMIIMLTNHEDNYMVIFYDNGLSYPVNAKFMGISSVARSIISMCAELGVQVVAQVPDAGPVPPMDDKE